MRFRPNIAAPEYRFPDYGRTVFGIAYSGIASPKQMVLIVRANVNPHGSRHLETSKWLKGKQIRVSGGETVTKADIIDQVSNGTGLTKLETEAVVNGFISVVKSELLDSGRVDLRGFGSFSVQHRAERTARNPRTNTPVHVPASDIPIFKPSKEFRKEVDEAVNS